MRFKIFVYAIIISLVSQTCKEEKPVEFKEVTKTTDINNFVELNIPEATGKDPVSAAINQSINELVITSLNVNDVDGFQPKTIEESIHAFNKEFTTFKTNFPDSALPWEAQIDGDIMYQSADVISISVTSYLNTGGAHGNLIITFLNFNAQTGKLLKNEDLFDNYIAFTDLAKTYFDEEVGDKKDLYFEPENFKLPKNIGFDEDGIILLYNTYEVAPYSSGITEIHIPWEDLQTSLNFL